MPTDCHLAPSQLAILLFSTNICRQPSEKKTLVLSKMHPLWPLVYSSMCDSKVQRPLQWISNSNRLKLIYKSKITRCKSRPIFAFSLCFGLSVKKKLLIQSVTFCRRSPNLIMVSPRFRWDPLPLKSETVKHFPSVETAQDPHTWSRTATMLFLVCPCRNVPCEHAELLCVPAWTLPTARAGPDLSGQGPGPREWLYPKKEYL